MSTVHLSVAVCLECEVSPDLELFEQLKKTVPALAQRMAAGLEKHGLTVSKPEVSASYSIPFNLSPFRAIDLDAPDQRQLIRAAKVLAALEGGNCSEH